MWVHADTPAYLHMQATPEPNGKKGPELCLAANWTQAYGQEGSGGSAWGYMDSLCSQRFIFMCRIMRGWLLLMSQHMYHASPACAGVAAKLHLWHMCTAGGIEPPRTSMDTLCCASMLIRVCCEAVMYGGVVDRCC